MGGRFSKKLEEAELGLTFDDVLVVPCYSEVHPPEADLSTKVSRRVGLEVLLVSSPMDTVTESEMAIALGKYGGIGIIHRKKDVEGQVEEVRRVKEKGLKVGGAVGVFDYKRIEALVDAGVDVIVIDTAHAHSKDVLESLVRYKRMCDVDIVAGNIATPEAAEALIEKGADGLRVGIGPGSACLTRKVSGVGVPQLYAIASVADVASEYEVPVIADGGIKCSGDIVKAVVAGADCVMIGNLFAGTDEAPGEVVEIRGEKFKKYRGMGSEEVIRELDRYSKLVPEGVSGWVPYKGSVERVIRDLIGGVKSGMGYVGARNLKELKEKGKFVRVTALGGNENRPRNLLIKGRAGITYLNESFK
ncbi:guanosine monophosphate reductase [Nanoarchaeota archaeon]|nr:MAG: guanosine monophosphate reductase [Nanoarchaeota archaeon]